MFDHEGKISEWRRRMLAAGITAPATLDELESHLREEVERQMRLGLEASRAFEIAAEKIGQAAVLRREFAHAGGAKWALLRKLKSLVLRGTTIPAPSPEDFAPLAQEALELAAGESRQFHHDFIGTEHVLLGLTQSRSGTVANVMQRLGLDVKTLRAEIAKVVGPGLPHEVVGRIPFTPYARKALQLAGQEARALRQPRINAEHILMGLMVLDRGAAPLVLRNLGIRVEDVRGEILKEARNAGV